MYYPQAHTGTHVQKPFRDKPAYDLGVSVEALLHAPPSTQYPQGPSLLKPTKSPSNRVLPGPLTEDWCLEVLPQITSHSPVWCTSCYLFPAFEKGEECGRNKAAWKRPPVLLSSTLVCSSLHFLVGSKGTGSKAPGQPRSRCERWKVTPPMCSLLPFALRWEGTAKEVTTLVLLLPCESSWEWGKEGLRCI